MRRSGAWIAGLAVLAFALAVMVSAGGIATLPADHASRAPAASPGGPAAGLPAIPRSDLPAEARTTLALIAAGGPFPYQADGAVYQNRERILPIRPAGTYHEFTVETPGSADRGGRRIVVAASGEAYWTADHYASFARILP